MPLPRLAAKAVSRARHGRFWPTPEALGRSRWLRWLGPSIQHPRLWRARRRGVALGLAIGIFFGLLIPVAQMPLSAAAAVLLRANLPAAVVSTFVTNPVTVAPLYYGAWKLGSLVLGEPAQAAPVLPMRAQPPGDVQAGAWQALWQRLDAIGRPLLLGLALMASATGLAAYLLVSWAWWLHVQWLRHRRARARRQRAGR